MITKEHIETFIDQPHLFGHYLGYKDLIPLHSEWITDAWISKNVEAMQAHRNSYKTTSILIVGAIWYLLFFDPDCTNLIIRKSDVDAQKIIKTLKAHFESEKVLLVANYLHGVNTLKTDNWSNSSITLSIKKSKTPEGSIEAKGSTSNITGSHYDHIFPDDIISLKDRVSKAEREWTKTFIRELKNIKKEGGSIFYSGTPWHKMDGWSILPKPKIYPIGTVPIKGYRPHEIEEKKKELRKGNTQSLYSANYELKHVVDEGRLFPEPKYGNIPIDMQTQAYLDPAYSGDNTTALSIAGCYDDQWYATGYAWPDNVIDLYTVIRDKLLLHNCGTLYIEENADKGLSKKEFEKIWPSVTGIHERTNKHIRIVSYAVKYFSDFIFDHNCDPEYMAQILDYQEGEDPDDAPDSLAGIIRELGFVDSTENMQLIIV